MTITETTRQNFVRIYGPESSDLAGDEAIFELTSTYRGDVTPTGRTPYVETTYYVQHHEAPANLGVDCPVEGVWSIEEINHSYVLDPASNYPEDPTEEEYSYDGGSDLWYWSEEEAIHACTANFARYDEGWKLNDWIPA